MKSPWSVCSLLILFPAHLLSQTPAGTALARTAPRTPAYTETVLYSFGSIPNDGVNPYAALILDADNNLYGTNETGGRTGNGTVFRVDQNGTETVLYNFGNIPDAEDPNGGLVFDNAGNLYGTGEWGGANNDGAVFKLDRTGEEIVLHSFSGNDGSHPRGTLLRDQAGNLYGPTMEGGASGNGALFRLNEAGQETASYSFAGTPDGRYPIGGLIRDAAGNFYGTTYEGGVHGTGTIFEVTNRGKEIVLYSFDTFAFPTGKLVRDAEGNLYGTEYLGGPDETGSIFKLDTNNQLTVLYSFENDQDGVFPTGGLLMDSAGNLYGTTLGGGLYGNGTVYEFYTSGVETVLHSFAGPPNDGAQPWTGVVSDAEGNLYGTTFYGGSTISQPLCGSGCGTVFKLSPN
jgi:uncharacterized repeat protein (TIGR03803 family)